MDIFHIKKLASTSVFLISTNTKLTICDLFNELPMIDIYLFQFSADIDKTVMNILVQTFLHNFFFQFYLLLIVCI